MMFYQTQTTWQVSFSYFTAIELFYCMFINKKRLKLWQSFNIWINPNFSIRNKLTKHRISILTSAIELMLSFLFDLFFQKFVLFYFRCVSVLSTKIWPIYEMKIRSIVNIQLETHTTVAVCDVIIEKKPVRISWFALW